MEKSLPDLARMAAYLAKQPDVILAYHFGSTAAGHARQDSDIDIAVLLDAEKSGGVLSERQLELMSVLDGMEGREVQLIILNNSTLFFVYQVIKTGSCFYERDKEERINFQVNALNCYFDFKPILDFQNRAFIERVKEKGLAGD